MAAAAQRFTALVLAADRGAGDPVSRTAGVAHKCLAPVAGKPMVERVVAALAASPHVDRIAVSLRDPGLARQVAALVPLLESGRLIPLQAADSPSSSVLQAAAELPRPFPLLVTTADHALLTTQMVDHFCIESLASGSAVAAGVTASGVLLARYPQMMRRIAQGAWECGDPGLQYASTIASWHICPASGCGMSISISIRTRPWASL